ncbi:MAG: ribosome maturation factor RimP [Burkholderiales bacterium]
MELQSLIESALHGLGFELVDLVLSNRGKHIQVFIDKPDGINLDDCARVSEHLGHVLAAETGFEYDRLEVSSPGLDRRLRSIADFVRFTGEEAQLKTRLPVDGQRNFKGILRGAQDGILQLEVDGVLHALKLANVEKARLVPNL